MMNDADDVDDAADDVDDAADDDDDDIGEDVKMYLMTIRRQIKRESRTGLRVAGTLCSRPVLGVPVPVAAIEGEKAEEGAPCVTHRPLQVLQKEPFLTGARRITHSTRRGGVSPPPL